MRLLTIDHQGELSLTRDLADNIPDYAILSHTWRLDNTEEVTFYDLLDGSGKRKPGYSKLRFCVEQAQKDNLQHFWVDTCCINKTNHTELTEAIASMFRWYCNSKKCYVYLCDVSTRKCDYEQTVLNWKSSFLKSRWFTRGWTLQELLAPKSVDFFSRDGIWLGNKTSLEQDIHSVTGIPIAALRGAPLSDFSIEERLQWAEKRATTRQEDRAYCLMGIFNVFIPLIYGEEGNAFKRLKDAINRPCKEIFYRRKQLLESLDDGHPFTRIINIPKCSEGTFGWVFDEPPSNDHRCPEIRFCQWLRQGDGVFWIVGKPGSGKSTLMKYLAGKHNVNQQTIQHLKTWAHPRSPCILSFYFWLDDLSGIQNSFRGLLCHILHQLLSLRSADFISNLAMISQHQQNQSVSDWDPDELESLLKDVVCRVAAETPLCIFFDALDECTATDMDRVVRLMHALVSFPDSKIKICVSSRSEQKLHNRLDHFACQSLKLHELTARDIRLYVADEFEKCWQNSGSSKKEKELIDGIVEYSEGVFLWAVLVTKRLCESIEFGDDINQLKDQLQELPRDMEQLYAKMIGKSDATNGQRMSEAATYFRFVIDHGTRRIPRRQLCSGVSHPDNRFVHIVPFYELYHGEASFSSPDEYKDAIRRRINFLCAGIVVADEHTVRFFHRTARDFFHEPYAKTILQQSKLTELESYCLFVDSLFGQEHRNSSLEQSALDARDMIRWTHDMRESNDAEKLAFLQHIDKTMSRTLGTTNWVYEQAKYPLGDDQVLDFLALTLQAETTILSQYLFSRDGRLSARYKAYLLMTLCSHDNSSHYKARLLALGADPNAIFYWRLRDRIKTTVWLQHLIQTSLFLEYDHFDGGRGTSIANTFLDHGANLDDRAMFLRSFSHDNPVWGHGNEQTIPSLLENKDHKSMTVVIEVNARYLLEEHCCATLFANNSERRSILFRPDVQKSQSYRRILLVHPGYPQKGFDLSGEIHPRRFAKVGIEDSEKLLVDLLPTLVRAHAYFPWEIPLKYMKIAEIWKRSPKVDIIDYLEEKGYYKKPDDPEVLQGLLPVFEDRLQ